MDLLKPSLALFEKASDLLNGARDGLLVVVLLLAEPWEKVLARHLTQLLYCHAHAYERLLKKKVRPGKEYDALLDSMDSTSLFKS